MDYQLQQRKQQATNQRNFLLKDNFNRFLINFLLTEKEISIYLLEDYFNRKNMQENNITPPSVKMEQRKSRKVATERMLNLLGDGGEFKLDAPDTPIALKLLQARASSAKTHGGISG